MKIVLLMAAAVPLIVATAWADYQEAPMLAARVAAGELPPVEERLPPNPPVVTPLEEIGQYGGTLRMAINSPYGFAGDGQSTIGPETILRISPQYNAVLPGIAESYEFQNDGRTLLLSLVPGINWSSGEPFTADDILFWYEQVLLDDELTPSKPVYWMPGAELMTVSKVDTYNLRLDFAEPYPIATMLLAHYRGFPASFYHPAHYMRDFHPSVVDKAKLEARTKEAGFDAWHQLFKAQYRSGYVPTVVGYPVINPYMITSISGDVRIFERNPYYWKIDPAKNQLPYIDSVVANYIGDAEVANLKMIQGELDYAARQMTMQNYPLYWRTGSRATIGCCCGSAPPPTSSTCSSTRPSATRCCARSSRTSASVSPCRWPSTATSSTRSSTSDAPRRAR